MPVKLNSVNHHKDDVTLQDYFRAFKLMSHHPNIIMEIGIDAGGSLLLWNDMFAPDLIVGLDWELSHGGLRLLDEYSNIQLGGINVDDDESIDRIAQTYKQRGLPFDMIVDDASHDQRRIAVCLEKLSGLLRPGGAYIIEDWRAGERNLQTYLLDRVWGYMNDDGFYWESVTIMPSMLVLIRKNV